MGPLLTVRVLAEIGDDAERFTSPSGLRAFAGTVPITRASGRSHYVKAHKVRNKRLGDACHWWAFSMLTKSAGAERITTSGELPATTTMPHCAISPTNSSGGSGGACNTTNDGTTALPGRRDLQ
ncbi:MULTISPECIES: IS110 family transposase [unclassified Rhodococcus (in: high G+C Gram-positive bacteria)]|uniref:IS110 family transposase n=1 Tax=unclassified Rhodococcus (in: high G+C Gram-positive bacteria) TaxID=192944 RepID=UPI0021C58E45|nr:MULTISPECIES: IS110 family transposase [unclassified Rhodococcus (in: high G+C Gram-positive bacteria)]